MADRFTMGGYEECGGHDELGYVEICERPATSLRSHWLAHPSGIRLERREVRDAGEPRIHAMRKDLFGVVYEVETENMVATWAQGACPYLKIDEQPAHPDSGAQWTAP